MILVFLANGFEEIEALATVDVLRRADLSVLMVGVGGKTVMGAHGIAVVADCADSDSLPEEIQAVILPGGLPGTTNLEASPVVQHYLEKAAEQNVLIGAICAAPSILGHNGLLRGKRATCYPGYEEDLLGAVCTGESVVTDGGIVTAKGAGVSVDFGLAIVSALVSPETAKELGEKMQCKQAISAN